MKKILSAILMAALLLTSVLAFTACGGAASDPVLKVIDIPLTSEEYAFAVKKGDAELLASVNAFLAEIKANGKFDEIVNKYFGDGTPTGVTSAAEDASKDQLVVATNAAFAPFEYKEGDTYYGVDMEIMAALAESLGKELVISNMEFESVCTAVAEGMCDVAAAGLTVNETRKEFVNFTASYATGVQVIIVPEGSKIKSVDDLFADGAFHKIGVQEATTGDLYSTWDLEDAGKAEVQRFPKGADAVNALVTGKVDCVIIDSEPAKVFVANNNK